MTKTLISVSVVGIVVAVVIAYRLPNRTKTASTASPDLSQLQDQIDGLQARVRASEVVGAAALGRATAPKREPDQPTTSAQPSDDTPPPPPAPPKTQTEAVTSFQNYFASIDELRGGGNDIQSSGKIEAELSKDDWRDGAPGVPIAKKVSCGNGYCRVSLEYKSAGDGEAGRMKLMLALGSIVRVGSIFFDPENLSVEGYFTVGDTQMPSFPAGS